jgi:thiamine pyrophosphate-dependent acetolactate synthase large subunit-like protein
VHIADGISRASNGKQIGVFAPQGGPGIENSFAGVAQSYGDNTPLLLLPGPAHMSRTRTTPYFSAVDNFAHVTKWGCELAEPRRVWELLRRAFSQLRTGKPGPVMLEMMDEVTEEECGEYDYRPVSAHRFGPDPADVRAVADILLSATCPVIHAGAGVLWSEATAELVELAELLSIPVLTTNPGKGGFPENHPLSLGAMVISAPKPAFAFLKRADVLFGVGTSFTTTVWGPQVPSGKRIVHLTNGPEDINKDNVTEAAMLSDVKLGLRALIAEIGSRRRPASNVIGDIKGLKDEWRAQFEPQLRSDEVPINQYRIVNDLLAIADPANTIVTHEAGSPREQLVPFWETTTPRGYLGWGKSTQLGAGLGMIMGAKLVHPEKLCVNFMGDASIGMVGMDIETAVRCKIGILTIVFNNGVMAGERRGLEFSEIHHNALDLGGNYSQVAAGLGAWTERIEQPGDFRAAAQRAIDATRTGRPALIEIMAKQSDSFSRYPTI